MQKQHINGESKNILGRNMQPSKGTIHFDLSKVRLGHTPNSLSRWPWGEIKPDERNR